MITTEKDLYNLLEDLHNCTCSPLQLLCAIEDNIDVIFLSENEPPKHGDLFVTEEPTFKNFCQGIPDIVKYDECYHRLVYDNDSTSDKQKMYAKTGGGTWLEIIRIIERDGKPVIYLSKEK